MAVCLTRRRFTLDEIEEPAYSDRALHALAAKVRYEIDPNAGFPRTRTGEVIVRLRDGRVLRERNEIDPDVPAAESEILDKYAANTAGCFRRHMLQKCGTASFPWRKSATCPRLPNCCARGHDEPSMTPDPARFSSRTTCARRRPECSGPARGATRGNRVRIDVEGQPLALQHAQAQQARLPLLVRAIACYRFRSGSKTRARAGMPSAFVPVPLRSVARTTSSVPVNARTSSSFASGTSQRQHDETDRGFRQERLDARGRPLALWPIPSSASDARAQASRARSSASGQ